MSLKRSVQAKSPRRILLVDDNRPGLAARRAVLEEFGYSTHGVISPKEAVKAFKAAIDSGAAYDLVITDFKMPEFTGVELIQQIRSMSSAVPIILLSGFVDALGLTERTTGADVVIMKSANEVQHLVRAVNRHLSGAVKRKGPKSESAAPRATKRKASGS